MIVYAAFVQSRCVYVGKTRQPLPERIRQHSDERSGPWKLGPVDVEWRVLRVCRDSVDMDATERAAIRALRPPCNERDNPEWLPLTPIGRLRGLCGSWWRRGVRMVRRCLELVGAAVVVAGAMWWWLG